MEGLGIEEIKRDIRKSGKQRWGKRDVGFGTAVAAGYFFSDILRVISAMRRGRRSARTLSTMLATSWGFSGGAVLDSCTFCSAPAATAMAADSVGAGSGILNSSRTGSAVPGLASPVSRICRQLAQAAAVFFKVSESSLG